MIDKRVIERQIRKGKLDAQAYRRTLEALPDVSDRVARDTDVAPARSQVSAADHGAGAPESEADLDEVDSDEDESDEDDEGDEGDEAAPDAPTTSY